MATTFGVNRGLSSGTGGASGEKKGSIGSLK